MPISFDLAQKAWLLIMFIAYAMIYQLRCDASAHLLEFLSPRSFLRRWAYHTDDIYSHIIDSFSIKHFSQRQAFILFRR